MGFSVSTASSILLIGAVMVFSLAFPVVEDSIESTASAFDTQHEQQLKTTNTDFKITNATYNSTTGTLNLTLNNTGAQTLTIAENDYLLDGQYYSANHTSIDGNSARSKWYSGEQLNVSIDAGNKPGQVKVVVERGVARITTEVTSV